MSAMVIRGGKCPGGGKCPVTYALSGVPARLGRRSIDLAIVLVHFVSFTTNKLLYKRRVTCMGRSLRD